MKLADVKVGMRVKLHPAAGLWMRGVKYATVSKVGRKWVTIVDDVGRQFQITPFNLQPVQ
jgi:hypothetical protein